MTRDRRYRREVAKQHINHRKKVCKEIYNWPWYDNDNQYSKNKVFCSCGMCRGYEMYLDELDLRSFQSVVDSQCEEVDEELKVRVPNRFIYKRNHHYSHGWK